MSTTDALLDRLCRTILLNPIGFDPEATPSIARRSALLQNPVAGSRLIERAVDRLRGWLDRFPEDLAINEFERSGRWDWSIPWPPSEPTSVFSGWGDFRFRHLDGSIDLVLTGDARADRLSETVRTLLSARSLAQSGVGDVSRAWWLSWDSDEPMRVDRFDDVAIQLAIELWSESLASRRSAGPSVRTRRV